MKYKLCLPALVLALTPCTARAEVRPNNICTDGMVLQQNSKAKIWGTAAKGEKVTVSFRGQTGYAEPDASGNWVATIATGEAGGPFEMQIVGSNKIAYSNVLVGEVWICSGQSNMEWSVNGSNAADKETAKGEPHNWNLRMFTVKHETPLEPVANVSGSWVEAKPETVGGFSAAGYFFGRDLQKALKVPVGLIHTSWGGTRAEAWTSKEYLDGHDWFKHEHPKFDTNIRKFAYDLLKFNQSQGKSKVDAAKEGGKKIGMGGPQNPINANSPSVLYNGMIAPLLNYSIKGAIWYQGESNAGQAYKYRALFPMMIQNWRKDFNQGDFPFYFVQLAPYTRVLLSPSDSDWAELREAQTMTLKLNHTGMAVITDLGNEFDIHPTPKQPVGERLSLCARALTYGEKIPYSGPMYKNAKFSGEKAILSFDHVGGGLVAKKLVAANTKGGAWRVDPSAKDVELTGFTICGKDRKFVDAKALIQGNDVIVSSPDVADAVAVRYGWANHPICGLFNQDGLPASPFRTDDFPGVTRPK
jgi:sialate O-acetylesterase